MYGSAFCRAYNEFGWNVYPEVFADQLLDWIALQGIGVKSSLDLGCGTGVLCARLAERGIDALGVDLSADMVARARENFPGLAFETGDMVRWTTSRRFDLVTCTGDALNHVFEPNDLEWIFRNVYGYLSDGGAFVFDLLSEGEIPSEEPFELEYSPEIRAVFRTSRQGDEITLRIAVYENGALQCDETIREKLHPREKVCALLEKCSFRVLQCADRLIPGAENHGTTWFIAADKGRTGGKFSDL